jgi:hypothetical protein
VGGVSDDDNLLTPSQVPEILQQLAKARGFGLVVGIIMALDQGTGQREVLDEPLNHELGDPQTKDRGLVIARGCILGHGMLGPPLALGGAVANQA